MRELDALVGSYVHLDKLPRSKDALRSLQKIASLVKPIMRKRGWRVGTLAEFWPDQRSLLGLNVNRGQKICLRLRYPGDKDQFMPLEHVVDTMLHELSHNVHGPHDSTFHALWNELRDEYDDLKYKGYTGEAFLTEGRRLGGQRLALQDMRRQARQAAERHGLKKAAGQKLGGRAASKSTDIRAVIADAATRRQSITQGCASNNVDSESIANEATNNGFRTQAEEDQANDRAIAEALWELAQEEAGVDGGVDSPGQWESEGLSWNPKTGLEASRDQEGAGSGSSHQQSRPEHDQSLGGAAARSSLLPASRYQAPPAKRQKQDLLLPSTTYQTPRKTPPPTPMTPTLSKLADPHTMLKPIPPPIPPSPPMPAKHLRSNPQTETMRPDSTTLGTNFTVPKSTAKKPSRPPPSSQTGKTEKALPPLPSPRQPSAPAPPLASHPAFRQSNAGFPAEQQQQQQRGRKSSNTTTIDESIYQPSISSADSPTRDDANSPHPSAFHSPVFATRTPATAQQQRRPPALDVLPVPPPSVARPPTPPPSVKDAMWTCPVCTLSNPSSYLCCDACATERPCHGSIDDWSTLSSLWPDALPTAAPASPAELHGSVPWREGGGGGDDDEAAGGARPLAHHRNSIAGTDAPSLPRSDSSRSSVSAVSGASSSSPRPGRGVHTARATAILRTARSLDAASRSAVPVQHRRLGWICACGSFMEERWWTCSSCGKMKPES